MQQMLFCFFKDDIAAVLKVIRPAASAPLIPCLELEVRKDWITAALRET